jgi:hypothetical protein
VKIIQIIKSFDIYSLWRGEDSGTKTATISDHMMHHNGRIKIENVDKRILRRISGPKREEITEEERIVHGEKLHYVYS